LHIRVLLVEDDVNFQNSVVAALNGAADMVLVDIATTRAQGLAALELPQPDVLLVDLGLPDGSGIDVIRAAHAQWPGCAIMVSTSFGDEEHVLASIEAGASGYLLKDSSPYRMVDEIRSLHAGGSPISPLIARQVLMRFRHRDAQAAAVRNATPVQPPVPLPPGQRDHGVLSARELEVLTLITKGFKADEIANLMQVSSYTVKSFVRRIYAKLEVRSKAEAIYEARSQGLLDD
jgi:DNA-binding NarL/FixJ family response regulator